MNSVTVVIPTFNRAGLLGRCIQAALDQTVPCEVVVCDHGSTDDTPAVARAFGDRIRYLRREVDSGIHFAWLDGVMGAKGEFVHINFDDDLVRPRFVERCLALMAPDVGLCMSQAEVQDASTGRTVEILFGEIGETGVWPMQRLMDVQLANVISPGATLLRRLDLVDNLFVGKVPLARHHYRGVGPDWLMTSMLSLRYPRFGYVAEPLAVFSAHEQSITMSAGADDERGRAFRLAYEESRRFYMIALLAQRFGVGRLADLALFLRRQQILMRRRLSRLRGPGRAGARP
jgi:glycosyltransferase involved in cell wall biosynthesis